MEFKFDHAVHYIENLPEAMKMLKEHGFHVIEGGKHQKRSTHNILSYFDLSYLELISSYDKESLKAAEHPKHSLMASIIGSSFTEGFVRTVIRTTDIEEAAHYFKKKGLTVNGPVYLSRKRTDGSLLEWRLLFIGDDTGSLEFPFIIQWNDNDETRRKDLLETGSIAPDSTDLKFSHITFAVKDLDKTVKKWTETLNFKAGELFLDEDLGAKCQVIEVPGGNFVMCTPIGEGAVASILEERGEKPFQADFISESTEGTVNIFGGLYRFNKQI